MKIFINSNYEIKAIYGADNPDLTEVEIDRGEIFGDKPDIVILGYCYKAEGGQVSVYPYVDVDYLELLSKQYEMDQIEKERLETHLTETQIALCDLYETVVK